MDVLQTSAEWLESMRSQYRTIDVTYTVSGQAPKTVQATVGRSIFDLEDSNGVVLRQETRDYLIAAVLLNAEPKAGDMISEGGHTYEVSDFGSEPAWRWTDAFRTTYRVHCKEVKP